MKLNFKLSRLALEDIDSIWEYTVKNWSVEQAEKYYNLIFNGIDSICRNPETGKSINEVKQLHRRLLIGSHMIIYKQHNNLILVDRILHQRMDCQS